MQALIMLTASTNVALVFNVQVSGKLNATVLQENIASSPGQHTFVGSRWVALPGCASAV